eukprot:TRINITY_DN8050_c0_g1_i1.p1 TRINITY_DN8050_c0_g1~~TRINITY_DN8050_c0_g1_i1.p1  ORF type:complete len:364 (-),score=47.32 TRINITY_DN8050_c0_g1_i1:11-1102(-)
MLQRKIDEKRDSREPPASTRYSTVTTARGSGRSTPRINHETDNEPILVDEDKFRLVVRARRASELKNIDRLVKHFERTSSKYSVLKQNIEAYYDKKSNLQSSCKKLNLNIPAPDGKSILRPREHKLSDPQRNLRDSENKKIIQRKEKVLVDQMKATFTYLDATIDQFTHLAQRERRYIKSNLLLEDDVYPMTTRREFLNIDKEKRHTRLLFTNRNIPFDKQEPEQKKVLKRVASATDKQRWNTYRTPLRNIQFRDGTHGVEFDQMKSGLDKLITNYDDLEKEMKEYCLSNRTKESSEDLVHKELVRMVKLGQFSEFQAQIIKEPSLRKLINMPDKNGQTLLHLSLIHTPSPRDRQKSRMPSSA